MPADKRTRPRVRAQLQTGTLVSGDPSASRLLSDLGDAVGALETGQLVRSRARVDLALGANRIVHGLGRRAVGANVTPTVADATFAWSFAADGDRVAVITLVGVAQPGAAVEFYA